jgi:hypothetical protein
MFSNYCNWCFSFFERNNQFLSRGIVSEIISSLFFLIHLFLILKKSVKRAFTIPKLGNKGVIMAFILIFIPTFCLIVFLVLTCLFVFAWFILGNYWVFSKHSIVQYEDDSLQSYCNLTLYMFSFWSIIVTYLLMLVQILFKYCRK